MKCFDTNQLELRPLSQRIHDLNMDIVLPLDCKDRTHVEELKPVSEAIIQAKKLQKTVLMFMGGHVIRSGVQAHIIDMMQNGYISGIALNGAGIIHDYEFALIGATTENVKKYIKDGQFGMWKETSQINDIINTGYDQGMGIGEALGKAISSGNQFHHKKVSLLAAAYDLDIPVTVHVGIGQDIIHQHPNFDGAATGGASYRDFLKLAALLQNISKGVVMNFGSAVMAPEVFLKALSMARNIEYKKGNSLGDLTTLVCDLVQLPDNWFDNLNKNTENYYFRPYKTMLVRTIENGGKSYYVRGYHRQTVPGLWQALREGEINGSEG